MRLGLIVVTMRRVAGSAFGKQANTGAPDAVFYDVRSNLGERQAQSNLNIHLKSLCHTICQPARGVNLRPI
jgi:hypothetical protein